MRVCIKDYGTRSLANIPCAANCGYLAFDRVPLGRALSLSAGYSVIASVAVPVEDVESMLVTLEDGYAS